MNFTKDKKIDFFNFGFGLVIGIGATLAVGTLILRLGPETAKRNISDRGAVQPAEEKPLVGIDLNLDSLSQKEKSEAAAYLRFKRIKNSLLPKGLPNVYGRELGISFDQVQKAINKTAPFDPTYGKKKIALNQSQTARYVKIGSQTACKYCCGAKTLVFENGEAACGCAHSQMMRGLAAYLIKNHQEMSDQEILNELNKWRAVFFPKQTLSETLAEMEKAGDSEIKKVLQEFPEFLPQMVGGC
jgi:hypothetical protein